MPRAGAAAASSARIAQGSAAHQRRPAAGRPRPGRRCTPPAGRWRNADFLPKPTVVSSFWRWPSACPRRRQRGSQRSGPGHWSPARWRGHAARQPPGVVALDEGRGLTSICRAIGRAFGHSPEPWTIGPRHQHLPADSGRPQPAGGGQVADDVIEAGLHGRLGAGYQSVRAPMLALRVARAAAALAGRVQVEAGMSHWRPGWCSRPRRPPACARRGRQLR